MKKTLTVGILLLAFVSGCGPSWPMQWKASDAIRQAQGLVEDNIEAAKPHSNATGKVHLNEASGAARAVTSYVGQPKVRRRPIQPANIETINKALRDAARPAPTPRDVADSLPQEIEESVMPWAELGIAGLAVFAPGAAGLALRYRKRYKDYAEAFTQTVEGVEVAKDGMNAKAAEALLAELSKAQGRGTKKLVDDLQAKRARTVA
jgi:hypothetical protein